MNAVVSVALVLALVPIEKFPIDRSALCTMKMALPSQSSPSGIESRAVFHICLHILMFPVACFCKFLN